MSGYFTESNYENAVLQLLNEDLGYTYVYGPDVERDYHSPLYEDVLLPSLQRINKNLPMDALTEAIYKLKNFETGTLLQKNMVFMDYLQNGVPVKYFDKGEERSTLVYLVDFKNPASNEFTVANQWTFIENSEKRPDVILFVNGLPLVIVELKSPSREETDASAAYRQLRNYMYEIPSMFIYNAVCVMSDLTTSKAGTITSGEDRFMEWKTTDGSYENTQHASFDTFFVGLFEKTRFLDIVKNFICFNVDGQNTFKILAGYHQYFAVKKAIESTKHATVTDGKGGVFWHTQGSGKSLSMVFYAHYLQEALESPTIVVITDRNDLDDQLYGQFARCKDFLRQTPQHAESRKNLKELLANRQANGIIFTTMQKFEESNEALSERRNIIVMADEAHRGQYGLNEKVVVKQKDNGEVEAKTVIGTARIIRDTLPNATYIGFTGTPISTKDRDAVLVGFKIAKEFLLRDQCVFRQRDLPYTTQLIPLAAICAVLGKSKCNEPNTIKTLSRWYWCGILGEMYGGANETRYAYDIEDMVEEVNGRPNAMHTINSAVFYSTRLLTLQTRLSAAYKGIMALLYKEKCRDFMNNTTIDIVNSMLESPDIHHIFPEAYCEKMGIKRERYNSIINKTPILPATNRSIGGNAPSEYLGAILKKVDGLNEDELQARVESHFIDYSELKADNFNGYFIDRAKSLLNLIEKAMNKPVTDRDAENTLDQFGASLA